MNGASLRWHYPGQVLRVVTTVTASHGHSQHRTPLAVWLNIADPPYICKQANEPGWTWCQRRVSLRQVGCDRRHKSSGVTHSLPGPSLVHTHPPACFPLMSVRDHSRSCLSKSHLHMVASRRKSELIGVHHRFRGHGRRCHSAAYCADTARSAHCTATSTGIAPGVVLACTL